MQVSRKSCMPLIGVPPWSFFWTFVDLFSSFLQSISPPFVELYFLIYNVWCFSILFFFPPSFHFLQPFSTFSHWNVSMIFFYLSILQFLNPSPIPTWPNPRHHPPVPLASPVLGSLVHVLAVPKHGCLGTSNDACMLDHGTCSIPLLVCSGKVGHVFLSASLSSVLVCFCSSHFYFLLPSVLCWQCQFHVKLSNLSCKPFP